MQAREAENTALRDAITQRDAALQQLMTQYNDAARRLQESQQENERLPSSVNSPAGEQVEVSEVYMDLGRFKSIVCIASGF